MSGVSEGMGRIFGGVFGGMFKRRRKVPKGKLVTRMNATLKRRNDPVFARKFVTWGILISSVMVGLSIFVAIYFNPLKVAERKFTAMAREYYEDYYYDKFFGAMTEEGRAAKLETFSTTGLQPVLLRQLLLYQNGKNAGMKKYFDSKTFKCDRSKTSAQFFPVEPYGRTDYEMKINLECEGK